MNARLLLGVAGGCTAGFLAGWFLHPAAAPPPADEASVRKIAKLEADLDRRTAELDRLTVASHKETADKRVRDDERKRFSADSPEVKKMQDRMKQRHAEREKLRLDEKVAALKVRLNLTDEQAAAIRELMAKDPGGMQSYLARAMSGEKVDEKKIMADMLKPGRKDGELTSGINALLTPEQQEAYTAFRKEQRDNEVEVKANKELARLQSSLTLSPDQKDKAFDVLTKMANDEYDNPVNPMAGLMQQGLKMQGKNNDPEVAAHMDEIKAATDHAAQRRQMRVEAMREVLNPEQLALYEKQQKQGSMAEMMDSAFGDGGNPFLGGLEDDDEPAPGGGTGAGAAPKPPQPGR